MRLRTILIAAAGLLATAGPAVSAPAMGGVSDTGQSNGLALPVEGEITNPDWVARPNGDDVGRYYPRLAQAIELSGRSVLRCNVTAIGGLKDCQIVSEQPLGLGFGQAAVAMAALFRMKPQAIDGAPVDGGEVRIPIRFEMPRDDRPVTATPTPSGPHALDLARRIVQLNGDQHIYDRYAEESARQFDAMASDEVPSDDASAKARQIGLDALKKSFADMWPHAVEARAAQLATLPEADLSVILAFLESSSGRAYGQRLREISGQEHDEGIALMFDARLQARTVFCSQVTCLDAPRPVAPRPSATTPLPEPAKSRAAGDH